MTSYSCLAALLALALFVLLFKPKVGTRSVLYGAHCFFIHPFFVAAAWIDLYGWTWDPRHWVAFVVHDWGYWGCANMDGEEGEHHVRRGAKIMGLFDAFYAFEPAWKKAVARQFDRWFGHEPEGMTWYCFCFFHSRFMAKRYKADFSRLCVADKLAFTLEPAWLYLPRAILSRELWEYMDVAAHKEGKYRDHNVSFGAGVWAWHRSVRDYLHAWVREEVRKALAGRGIIPAEHEVLRQDQRSRVAALYEGKPPFASDDMEAANVEWRHKLSLLAANDTQHSLDGPLN